MPLVRRTLVERFEGGAAGESITTANSIFTLTSADEDPPYGARFFTGGRSGNLASNVPYPPSQGGSGLLRWDPPTVETDSWSLGTFYGYFHALDPASYPDFGSFLAAVVSLGGTEAAGLAILRDEITVTGTLARYEMWFRISPDRSLTADATLVNTESYLTVVSSLVRQPDGVTFGLHLSGAPSDPPVAIGSWYRLVYTRAGLPGAGVAAYTAAGSLLTSSPSGFAAAFDVLTRGVEIGLTNPLTYRPIEVDDVTITYEIWAPPTLPLRVTEHPTRRYPRDDGAGLSSAARTYPRPRAARNYGGQQ